MCIYIYIYVYSYTFIIISYMSADGAAGGYIYTYIQKLQYIYESIFT